MNKFKILIIKKIVERRRKKSETKSKNGRHAQRYRVSTRNRKILTNRHIIYVPFSQIIIMQNSNR